MRIINLRDGNITFVDDDDYLYLNEFEWSTTSKGRYVARWEWHDTKSVCILMHVVIAKRMGITIGIDHKNRDGLDNQRDNLRPATREQNNANREYNQPNKRNSKYKGVRYDGRIDKYTAYIYRKYHAIYLGSFVDEIGAARAYDCAAKRMHGEFARLNFPTKEN